MLDHITLRVRDFAASKAYYAAALAPLGYALVMEFPDGAGFGVAGKPDFWIMVDPEAKPQHVAFHAKDHASVDRYYAAAIGAGGRDNGAPGLRLDYHPNYYGAFVYDPSGHNIEAVCHAPPAAARKKAPARKAARTASQRKGAGKPAGRKGARKSRR
jgi:catechol 2,3-dioxygenase-like lactoylglutathione lyase family enzyme